MIESGRAKVACWHGMFGSRMIPAMKPSTSQRIAQLADPDPHVRREAARALGEAEAREAVGALCALLVRPADTTEETNPEHTARAAAAVALGRIGDPAATDALIEVLADPFNTGTAASTALGRLSPPPVDRLVETMRDEDHWRRARAVVALGECGDASAFEAMAALLDDPEVPVRRAAAAALGKLGDARAVPLLTTMVSRSDESAFVRSYAAVSLGALKDRSSIEALVEALDSSEPLLRRAAARALCRIDDPRPRKRLERMAVSDPDKSVRQIVDRYVNPRPGQREH